MGLEVAVVLEMLLLQCRCYVRETWSTNNKVCLFLVLLRYPKPTPKPRFFAKTVRCRNLGFFCHN